MESRAGEGAFRKADDAPEHCASTGSGRPASNGGGQPGIAAAAPGLGGKSPGRCIFFENYFADSDFRRIFVRS